MSDKDPRGKAWGNRVVSRLSQSESDTNHSNKAAHFWSHPKDLTPEIIPRNESYREALHFHTKCLANKFRQYDSQVARDPAKLARHLQVQVKTSIFDPFNLIFNISFLLSSKLTCEPDWIHEEAAMGLILFSMKM